jgi:hypothetical protein
VYPNVMPSHTLSTVNSSLSTPPTLQCMDMAWHTACEAVVVAAKQTKLMTRDCCVRADVLEWREQMAPDLISLDRSRPCLVPQDQPYRSPRAPLSSLYITWVHGYQGCPARNDANASQGGVHSQLQLGNAYRRNAAILHGV